LGSEAAACITRPSSVCLLVSIGGRLRTTTENESRSKSTCSLKKSTPTSPMIGAYNSACSGHTILICLAKWVSAREHSLSKLLKYGVVIKFDWKRADWVTPRP